MQAKRPSPMLFACASVRPHTRSLLRRALEGELLGVEEGVALARCREEELPALLEAAGELRDRHHGRRVTYSPKVFLPVTNLCRDRCSYCTFRKSPRDPEARTMTLEEIRTISAAGRRAGCKEALMCLGDRPETVYPAYRETLARWGASSTADYLYRACRVALGEGLLPHTNAGILSAGEMERLRRVNVSLGLMLENASPRLRRRGMAHAAAPDKDPEVRLRMIRQAGELRIPFTTGILVGIGETVEERVESLVVLREVHRRFGHLQEVIIQNFRAKPQTPMGNFPEPSPEEMVRTVAVARLLLGPVNLQAPPNLNPTAHRWLLEAGINDWGGISPVTLDFINPECPWPHLERLAETCREAGFELAERLAVYPEYYGWVDPGLQALLGGTA